MDYRIQLDLNTGDLPLIRERLAVCLYCDEYLNPQSELVEIRLSYECESYQEVWRQLSHFLAWYDLQHLTRRIGIGRFGEQDRR